MADTHIVSPFDGLIVRRDREMGDIVVPGAAIFLLVSPSEMWISAWVDESAMAGLAPGQPARVVFRSEPKNRYKGSVVRVGREVDRETREFRVDVGVKVLPANWAVGQRAEVYIEEGKKKAVLYIPVRALLWRKSKAGVYVAAKGRVNWRPVSLGLRGVDRVEIKQGLSKGELVVTGPQPTKLKEGQKVYAK